MPKSLSTDGTRFAIRDGMVRDSTTGLIWSQSNASAERLSWQDAQAACAALRLGGHSDWRLPSIRELLSLVDYERHEPAIDTDAFKCTPSWYWTSTPLHSSPGVFAWFVFFGYGLADWDSRDGYGWVRGVRVGQF